MLETKYYIQNGKYKKASRHFDRSQIVFSGSAFLSLFLSKNLKMNEETTKQSADSSVLILTIDFQEFFSDLFPWEPRDLAMSTRVCFYLEEFPITTKICRNTQKQPL